MKTEHRLAATLKEMMAVKSLDNISVLALTKKCHLNRQTFYYHFHDIYDLLTLVFLDEKINNIHDVINTAELLSTLYTYYENNKNFIDATLSSAGKDLFFEFVYNNCYQVILRIVTNHDSKHILTTNEKKAVSRFYASAFSNSVVYYLANYKHKTYQGLLSNFVFVGNKEIEAAVDAVIKTKEV